MADNVGGASSGDAMMAQLLQSALSASQQQNDAAATDDRRSDAVQQRLLQKFVEKKAVQEGHQRAQEVKETYTSERAVDKNWRALAEGKGGPELMQFANQASLQGKVSGKLKEMFLSAQTSDPARAEQAAGAMNRLITTQTFSQVAPTARDIGELAAKVLENPSLEKGLQEVLDHPFTKAPEGDRGTKQDLARFASRQTDAAAMGKGASVRMAGDMLGTLSGAKVPGFAQQAAMKMVERNPQNLDGIKNVDAFVKEPTVKAMPQMARGYATQVLAKGDGKAELKTSLTDVSKNDNFRAMSREDKGKLFATVGQGRASDLRAITDQTLSALRQKDFPRQAHQVESFLGGLSRQVLRGARGGGKAGEATGGTAGSGGASDARGTGGIDAEELVSTARRGGLPERPTLRRIPGTLEQGEAGADRSGGRGALAGQAASEGDGAEGGTGARPAGPARAGARAAAGESTATDVQRLRGGSGMPAGKDVRPGIPLLRPGQKRAPGPGEEEGTLTSVDAEKVGGDRGEEADAAGEGRKVQNRASLQAYFGKLTRHFDRIEQKIKDAQYFEDVNMLSGLKEPEPLDLTGLEVRGEVIQAYDDRLAQLKGQLDSRQLPRLNYIKQLKAVQAEAFARRDLSVDEKSYVYAKTAQAQAGQTFQELSGKKHRKLREVKNKLLPAEKRRSRLEPRRPQGVQPRFFRAGQGGGRSAATAPASGPPAGAGAPAAGGSHAGGLARPAAAGAPAGRAAAAGANAALGSGAAGRGAMPRQAASRASSSPKIRDILSRLDPSLSRTEQMQQAKELMAHDIQQQAMQMASELMEAILRGSGGSKENELPAGGEVLGSPAHLARLGPREAGAGSRPAAAPTTTGKTNFYGVPQSFERDLGANHNRRPVRAPSVQAGALAADAADDDVTEVSARRGKALMKDSATLRPLAQLRDTKMKDMSKLEANALKNLGWDAMSWGAQGQPGANIPTTYQTPFKQLRPLQKDSVRALGMNEDSWNAMVDRNSGK